MESRAVSKVISMSVISDLRRSLFSGRNNGYFQRTEFDPAALLTRRLLDSGFWLLTSSPCTPRTPRTP
jgi:hypothetical protein